MWLCGYEGKERRERRETMRGGRERGEGEEITKIKEGLRKW